VTSLISALPSQVINQTPAHICTSINADLCNNLTQYGWSQHSLFLPPELVLLLAAECTYLQDKNILRLAHVGRGDEQSAQANIRSDRIAWLYAGQSVACDAYLLQMEQVRLLINQNLYLGLEEYESHFSFYQPGASYSKHLDRFHDDDARTISVVVYLNEEWQTEQGGALRLHPLNLPTQDISPIACSLVVFLSAEMLHEVLPATRNRMSLTGWFRRHT
jgi:SM-20-related protein